MFSLVRTYATLDALVPAYKPQEHIGIGVFETPQCQFYGVFPDNKTRTPFYNHPRTALRALHMDKRSTSRRCAESMPRD